MLIDLRLPYPDRPPTPRDVLRQIVTILEGQGSYTTLALLQRCSSELYFLVRPILFRTSIICSRFAGSALGISDVREIDLRHVDGDKLEEKEGQLLETGNFFSAHSKFLRRLRNLQHAQHLIVRSFPPDTISQLFTETASTILEKYPDTLLFPKLDTIQILPDASDAIRTWIPDYHRRRNPPFLEFLTLTSNPRHLCLAFRVVNSVNWQDYRDATSPGLYQFVTRINRCREGGRWDRLNTLRCHDITHQVLPSLKGVENIYVFSTHIIPQSFDSTRTQSRFLSGIDSVNLPGPDWNFRPWQLSTAIKNLFPSGTDHAATLLDTSWTFINVQGQILTKPYRDDDDSDGVGVYEVRRLIEEALRDCLPLDLPAREGFDIKLVREVLKQIEYKELVEGGVCEACGRLGQEGACISRIQDVDWERY